MEIGGGATCGHSIFQASGGMRTEVPGEMNEVLTS